MNTNIRKSNITIKAMINYRIISSDDSAWDKYLYRFPEEYHDINFTSQYHRVMENKGNGKAELFVAEQNGNIYFHPYMLNRICKIGSVPIDRDIYDIQSVFGYTGPICNTDDEEFIEKAIELFESICRKRNIVVEFIRFNPLLNNHKLTYPSPDLKIIPLKKYVFVELNKTENEIFRGYKTKLRESINSADRDDKWSWKSSNEKNFYVEIVKLIERHLKELNVDKYYLGSESYYKDLYNLILENGRVFGAYDCITGELLAGEIFVFDKNTAYYLHTSYRSRDARTSKIHKSLIHKAFIQLKNEGFKYVCFGGGVSDSPDDSLLRYKNTFSDFAKTFYIGKRLIQEDVYSNICCIWGREFPHLVEKNKNIVLKYRFTS